MKLKELKLSHIIKTAVFGILMLFPFLAAASKCIYVAANKNAYLSYTGYEKSEDKYDLITDYEDLVVGSTYRLITNNLTTSMQSGNNGSISISDVNVVSSYGTFSNYVNDIENSTQVGMWYTSTYSSTYLHFNNASTNFGTSSNSLEITFKFMGYLNVNQSNDFSYYFGTMIYKPNIVNNSNNLDNVFYYANEQVWEEPLFNWVESSALQTSIGAFVSVFGLSVGSYFNNLITYWLSLTIIFIVINIVLDVIEWLIDLAPFKKKKS